MKAICLWLLLLICSSSWKQSQSQTCSEPSQALPTSDQIQIITPGQFLKFTGRYLSSSTTTAPILYLNSTKEIAASTYSETLVQFQMPEMPQGIYSLSIKFYDRGLVSTKLLVQYEQKLSGINQASFGVNGGILIINGQGFTTTSIIKLKTADEICKIIISESTPSSLKCMLPAKIDGTSDEIIVVDGDQTFECTDPLTCTVTWQDSNTKAFSSYEGLNEITLTNAEISFEFLGSALNDTTINYVFMVDQSQTSETSIQILSGSLSDGYPLETQLIVLFNNISPFTYKLYVNYDGKGFASIIPEILFNSGGITINVAEGEYLNTALEGTNELIIQGYGFDNSENITITICNDLQLNCAITKITSTQITCQLPELYDAYEYYLLNGEISTGGSSSGGGTSEIEYLQFEQTVYCNYCLIFDLSTSLTGYLFDFSLYTEADTPSNIPKLYDMSQYARLDQYTCYESNTPTNCWIDFNFGEYVFTMEEIDYWAGYELYSYNPALPFLKAWRLINIRTNLQESQFLGTNDTTKTTWDLIYNFTEMATNPYIGRNENNFGTTSLPQFIEYIFLDGHPWHYKIWRWLMKGGDPSYHKCRIGALEWVGTGYLEIQQNNNYQLCSVNLNINDQLTTWEDIIKYDQAMSSVALTITPICGSRNGGTTVIIEGVNFPTSATTIEVYIHGIECTVSTWNDTSIECVTGPQPSLIEESIIDIIFDGIYYTSVNPCMKFSYVNLWSDENTWGGELPPLQGETVYVPSGQSLLINQNTGYLNAIMIEGEVVVQDQEITIEANYIIVANGGKLIIGTPLNPFQNKATIILHGNQDTDKQLPLYGAKVLALYDGYLSIFGKIIEPTWSKLTASVSVGGTTLTLQHDALNGWEIGDEIIITSTSFSSTQTEKRIIQSINGNTITITEPLTYAHYGQIETYANGQTVNIAAEVALLTRSIVIKGDDEYSEKQQYGAHILAYGTPKSTSQVQLSYTEIYQCGQTKYFNRYPINFNNLNIQPYSYAIGNSIHHSYARMINLEQSIKIRISKNIGYDILGSGIVLSDGGSQQNIILSNLVADVQKTWNLDTSDQSPSSFVITSPFNNITGNVAAGSPYTGFYLDYDTFSTSQYNSYAIDLLQFSNNTAHSNYYGIYIPNYDPRADYLSGITLVCGDDSTNPRLLAIFSNCTIFKSQVYGLLLTKIGKVQFKGFNIIDSGYAAIFLRETQDLQLDDAQIIDSLIVGKSNNNAEADSYYTNQRGIELPTNENLQLQNIQFENFNQGPALLTCAGCGSYYYRTSGAHLYRTRQLSFINVLQKVQFGGLQNNDIFLDEDGSLVDQNVEGKTWYLTKWQAHLNGTDEEEETPACMHYKADEAQIAMYDNGIVCDSTLRKLHKIAFQSLAPIAKFTNKQLRIYRYPRGSLSTSNYDFSTALSEAEGDNFTNITHYSYYKDASYSWAMPFLTGYGYNIHWGSGIDFQQLIIKVSDYFDQTDENIWLRFNHTWDRETFDDNLTYGCPSQTVVMTKLESQWDQLFNTTHSNYYHDNVTKEVIVNLGGDEKVGSSSIKLVSISCRDFCPPEPPIPENVTMNWSNCSAWPSGACPIENENVTINPGYFVTMDIDPPCLGNLVINGELIFDNTRISLQEPSILCARNIWIQSGVMKAGNQEEPFPGFIQIELLGNKTDQGITLQLVDVGNKAIVVTGSLELYGQKIEKSSTKLKVSCDVGQNIIQVVEQLGWKIGDELLITATEGNVDSYEKKIITAIDENDQTLITLDSPLTYLHYGDINSIVTEEGQVDIRASVTLINKNIVIKTHDPENQWGFKIVETMELNNSNYQTYAGKMVLNNVKLEECGQYDLIGACIEFVNSTREEFITKINEISIVNSYDQGILIQNSQNIEIKNSIIADCSKFGIKLENSINITINNNIIAGVQERLVQPTAQLDIVAGIYLKGASNTKYYIDNNLVTSVQGFAYVLDGQNCTSTDIEQSFTSNIAQSSTVGWYARNSKKYKCFYIAKFTAAKCKYGIASYQQQNEMKFELFNLIENQYSIKVLAGNSEATKLENSVTMVNMFFMALGRPNCTACYQSSSLCSSQTAIKFIGFTLNYQSFPPTEYSLNNLEKIFNICSEGGLNMKTIISSSEFRGFYGGTGSGIYSSCSNNRAFSTNIDTIDGASSIYLKNSKCNNCDYAGIAKYNEIYGVGTSQCGDYNCTGLQNIMISDQTGGFINSLPSQIVPKFQEGYGNIINGVTCEFIQKIPGYVCIGERFGVLMAQSKDSDMRTRIISPLNITRFGEKENNETLVFQNLVNNFRSPRCQSEFYEDKYWQRFIGLIQLNSVYNVNYGSLTLPTNTFYQLAETFDSDFVVLSIDYHTGQSIRIETDSGIVAPIRLDLQANFNEQLWQTTCGSNLFDYVNQNIRVSILSSSDCKVYIKVVDAVKINVYFETTVQDFYENNGIATFVDKVAAYLGINIWQLKIVSFSPFNGRLLEEQTNTTVLSEIVFFIESQSLATSTNEVDEEKFQKQLKPLMNQFVEGIKSGNLSFHKKIHSVETSYASANNTKLEDKGENSFSPNYTDIYEYQCLTLGNCDDFEEEEKITEINSGNVSMSKTDVEADGSNNQLIIFLTITFSAVFIILMGLLIWRMHSNKKKKLQDIKPSTQNMQDAAKLDAKFDYQYEKSDTTNNQNTIDIQLRQTTANRARTFTPLITNDSALPQSPSKECLTPELISSPLQSSKQLMREEKERTGSDEELLKSNNQKRSQGTNLPPPVRRPNVRSSQFQPLKSSKEIEDYEDVEVIKFE